MRAQQNSIDAKMSRLNKTSIRKFILILKTNNFMLNFMVESLKEKWDDLVKNLHVLIYL